MKQSPLLVVKPELQDDPVSGSSPAGFFRHLLSVFLFRTDWLQIVSAVILLAVGALFIYGTGQQIGGFAAATFWKRHLIYMAVGGGVWLIFSLLDYRWCGPFSVVLYAVSLLLLVGVLFFGKKYFGARSWLEFGPLNFQPSELAKFALVVLCAWVLSWKRVDVNKPLWLGLILVLLLIPAGLTRLQPDLGTALAMVPPVGAMVFTARLKWRYIAVILVLCAVSIPVAYYSLKPYQKERILVFFDPGRDPSNRGWNQLQAEMTTGDGGLTGKGFMNGTHNMLGYLPQKVSNSDFIFPVIAEETGFLGSLGLLFLYLLLMLSIFRTALLAPDGFGRYLCVGIAFLLFFHVFINIGMCVRLCPVTGLPLPLVSYGGTFLVTTLAYLGIVHSVYGHREQKSIFDL